MRAHFRSVDWSKIITDDPEMSCDQVTCMICDAMKQYIPNKSYNVSPSDPAWWTPECAEAVAEKERLWKKWRRDPQKEHTKREFNSAVVRAVRVLSQSREAKRKKLKEKLSSRSLSDKEWWSR